MQRASFTIVLLAFDWEINDTDRSKSQNDADVEVELKMRKNEMNLPLGNFACFQCRKTFSRAYSRGEWKRVCPTCGGVELYLGPKWKSPKSDKDVKWKIIELFVVSGKGYVFTEPYFKPFPFPRSVNKAKAIIEELLAAETQKNAETRMAEAKKGTREKKTSKRLRPGKKQRPTPKSMLKGLIRLKHRQSSEFEG